MASVSIRSEFVVAFSVLVSALATSAPADDTVPRFDRDIVPVLSAHCWRCHGGEGRKMGLDFRTVALILKGGDNGSVVHRGSAETSRLYQRIANRSMPPPSEEKKPLTDDQIQTIRRWIDSGIPADQSPPKLTSYEAPLITDKDRGYWAFRKPQKVRLPKVRNAGRVRSPIDAFVLSRLEDHKLTFSADAQRRVLIRRASMDLIGLPPSLEEIESFLRNNRPDAYARLIDRLLASPHFGERLGRHWLDAAGYSDIYGSDNDAAILRLREGIWQYRDYVVRSFNEDKPYDRFLLEQLAGDEIVDWRSAKEFTPEIKESLIATGFLRSAIDDTAESELNTALSRYEVVHRTLNVLGTNLMGLTVGCARCHTHKFDPIPQRDYYRLAALFTPSYNPQDWLQPQDRWLADIAVDQKKSIDAHNADIDRQIEPLSKQLTEVQKKTDRTDEDKATEGRLQKSIAELQSKKQSYGKIQALYDVGPPPPNYLLRRGNHETPGPEIEPGFLSVLCNGKTEVALKQKESHSQASGCRSSFAHWLVDRTSPSSWLVARVYVNRIWQHLFGVGIVSTSENFGSQGARPTHPELLDWLTLEFVRGGMRTKPMIRQIMMSTTYRQRSDEYQSDQQTEHIASRIQHRASSIEIHEDPDNLLLWRQRLRRLESEIVRDAVLSASGRLDASMGGPPIPTDARPDGTVVIAEKELPAPTSANRRSIYLLARRNYHLSFLNVFDQPGMNLNCTRRDASAIVSQSFTMLNDRFIIQQSRHFAERVASIAGVRMDQRIRAAFCIALGREPSQSEIEWSHRFIEANAHRLSVGSTFDDASKQALASLCQMLMNTNEFLYVE